MTQWACILSPWSLPGRKSCTVTNQLTVIPATMSHIFRKAAFCEEFLYSYPMCSYRLSSPWFLSPVDVQSLLYASSRAFRLLGVRLKSELFISSGFLFSLVFSAPFSFLLNSRQTDISFSNRTPHPDFRRTASPTPVEHFLCVCLNVRSWVSNGGTCSIYM